MGDVTMHIELTEEQELVKANVKEFCEKYVDPIADQVDQEAGFPAENIKRLAEQDMLGIPYPEQYGGAGSDYLTYIMTSRSSPMLVQPRALSSRRIRPWRAIPCINMAPKPKRKNTSLHFAREIYWALSL